FWRRCSSCPCPEVHKGKRPCLNSRQHQVASAVPPAVIIFETRAQGRRAQSASLALFAHECERCSPLTIPAPLQRIDSMQGGRRRAVFLARLRLFDGCQTCLSLHTAVPYGKTEKSVRPRTFPGKGDYRVRPAT